MARLEDITVDASITGLDGNSPVTVVAVKWHGNAVLEVTYKNADGKLYNQLLYRENEEKRLAIIVENQFVLCHQTRQERKREYQDTTENPLRASLRYQRHNGDGR